MIKTERQYQQARVLYQEGTEQLQRQVEALKLREYSEDEIKCLTGCTARMLEENKKALDLYKRLRAKDPTALRGLSLNRQLIGLRIFLGLSQSKLAALLGVSRTKVARDERNEYSDLTLERYHQILRAMGLNLVPVYVQGDWNDAKAAELQLCGLPIEVPSKIIIG